MCIKLKNINLDATSYNDNLIIKSIMKHYVLTFTLKSGNSYRYIISTNKINVNNINEMTRVIKNNKERGEIYNGIIVMDQYQFNKYLMNIQ
jgi:bifunctional N-acetylglucosamine-1-phosphate-uridyltransferase/glucosamine-1-phosphate-acetyltransferase GlmU-like protein